MANPLPLGNELVYIQGLDGAGNLAAGTEPFTLTQLTNFEGSTYLASSVSVTSTTLITATGMSVTLQSGGVYVFDLYLSVTNGASGGLKLLFQGTATASAFTADTWAYNTASVVAQGVVTALLSTATLVAYTGGVTTVNITGTIAASATGTFGLSFSQNVSNGTATTLNKGSNFWVDRLS